MNFVRTSAAIGSAAAGIAIAVTGAFPVQAASTTYSGRAYAVGVTGATVLGTPVGDTTVADTGQLPVGGGNVTNGPGTFPVPKVGSVTVVMDQANGAGSLAAASSEITSVNLAPGKTAVLHATLLKANTAAAACGGTPTVSSSVASLTIGGTTVPIPIAPAPNTQVTVPLGATGSLVVAVVTFNAQSYAPASNTQSVSAVEVNFPVGGALSKTITGTVVISHAESDLLGCSSVTPAPPSVTPAHPVAPPAPPVPTTGAGFGSVALVPAGILLLGASLFGIRRRNG